MHAFTRKPVWEGQFEIVLANDQFSQSQATQLLQNNPAIATLIGAGAGSDQLETEVEILESPSVLKPVFDFVKKQKQSLGDNVEKWRYSDWLEENLSIELLRGTSVLD